MNNPKHKIDKNPLKCIMIDARYIQKQTSGIGRYTEHLIENLLRIDDNLRIRLITHPSRPAPFKNPRVDHQVYAPEPNSLRTRYQIKNRIDFSEVELFHSTFNILPRDLPVQSVFTLHDIMWLINANFCTDSRWRKVVTGTFYKKYIPESVNDATRILTVSHHSKSEIEKYFPEKKGKVNVTYNGVDPIFRPMEDARARRILRNIIPSGKKFVLVVGQGSPYKNHAGALGAFIEAFRHEADIYFVLVRRFQRGPAKEFDKLAADPSIAHRLIHLDHVPFETLLALYSAARVFLFPSFYEGFGLPALEAMASGTPVVVSDRGAPAEIGGAAGVQIDPYDRQQIAAELRKLVYEDDYYAQTREAGLKRASEFTWERTATQALQAYHQAMNGVKS